MLYQIESGPFNRKFYPPFQTVAMDENITVKDLKYHIAKIWGTDVSALTVLCQGKSLAETFRMIEYPFIAIDININEVGV